MVIILQKDTRNTVKSNQFSGSSHISEFLKNSSQTKTSFKIRDLSPDPRTFDSKAQLHYTQARYETLIPKFENTEPEMQDCTD